MDNFSYLRIIWFIRCKGSLCYSSSCFSLRGDNGFACVCYVYHLVAAERDPTSSISHPKGSSSSSSHLHCLPHGHYPSVFQNTLRRWSASYLSGKQGPPRENSLSFPPFCKGPREEQWGGKWLEWSREGRSYVGALVQPSKDYSCNWAWWEPSGSSEQRSAIFHLVFYYITPAPLLRLEWQEIRVRNSGSLRRLIL